MQTSLPDKFLQTAEGHQADKILRKCVHCGFCNATCPTYQLTGNELDGPRGRIYLIKNYLEGNSDGSIGLRHLDRCLTCLSCETTCPSNVRFGNLLDTGRKHMNETVKRPLISTLKRHLIIRAFSKPSRVRLILALARLTKPFLPKKLATKMPVRATSIPKSAKANPDLPKMLTIRGCVQSVV
ncbi:MAG: 4Fe-4S dicluster domain-containing protein, partial [Proteobacteria bacterium]|nr:4Fe-4S dicluster domain-containing protein [Pseudomonadota bacterium]